MTKKKEDSKFDEIRRIWKLLGKQIDIMEDASGYKIHDEINKGIVTTESLWQELRYMGQNL